MGSPDEPRNRKAIDASVGGLVWVRRRNGSWWPGRIVGLDELSESCLVSPRAGTPVKLLGREDASIDWYNLEKSKRVKAFRCGEYDRCIEKAKASAANSGKKVVKYARREDAILHALEIESARLGKDHPDYFCRRENSGGEHKSSAKDSPRVSPSGQENGEMTDERSELGNMLVSVLELSRSKFSLEEPNHMSAKVQSADQAKRRRTPNDSEDDGTEGIQRMRGLEDLGMVVGSKRKVQAGGMLGLVQQERTLLCDSSAGKCSSLKRKRSQVANAHESLKRKNRHRPLTKVLESTAMVSVPASRNEVPSSDGFLLNGLSENRVSGIDANELRESCSMLVNNNIHSDCAGVSLKNNSMPLNADANVGDGNHMRNIKISCQTGIAVLENASSDRLFDVPLVVEDKPAAGFSSITVSCPSEMPEAGGLERKTSKAADAEAVPLKGEGHNEYAPISSVDLHAGDVSNRIEEGTSKWQLKGKRNSRQISKDRKGYSRKVFSIDGESDSCLAGVKQLDEFPQGSGEKTDYSSVCNSVQGSAAPQMTNSAIKNCGRDPPLYDVVLEVEASCRPQRVPLVSLMSKLNGEPIVGHPVTVEVLNHRYCSESIDGAAEGNHSVRRNTGSRKGAKKRRKLRPHFSSHKSSKLRKCGILSKKTRKLSSLSGQKQGEGNKNHLLEKTANPVVSCFPLKLVFGRLNEALNGSRRPKSCTLTAGNS